MQTDSRMKLLYLTSPSGYFLGEHVWYICGDFCRPLVRNTSPGVSADNVSCIVWIMWPTGFMWVRGLELPVPSTQDVYSNMVSMFTFSKPWLPIPAPFVFHLLVGMELSEGCVAMNALAFVSITAVFTFKHVYLLQASRTVNCKWKWPMENHHEGFWRYGCAVSLSFNPTPGDIGTTLLCCA